MLDILIRNGKICDGTGNPWYRADIGVRNGEIVEIGAVREKARKTIDAAGRIVSPGFVDVHTHACRNILARPSAENVLRQGVTTVVAGNCGGSPFPIGEQLDKVEAAGPAVNYATLFGHGTIRTRAMGGPAKRDPTAAELKAMRRLAEEAMDEGALGMSTGLFYIPGAYAKLNELVCVSRVVADCGGVYASHKRSAGGKVFEAIREAAAIGRKAGVSVEVSHLKVLHRRGRTDGSRAGEVLSAIRRHRESGVDMTYDTHPYPATNTSLSAVAIPPWVSKDGKLKERLQNKSIRKSIRSAVASNIAWMGGAAQITIAVFKPDKSLEGASLAEAAASRKRNFVDTAMDMIVEGSPSCIFHALRTEDVSEIICGPDGMIASDGGIVLPDTRVVHPRNYGTFPRVIREYVREKKQMTIEEAVRKMTSLPARKFGIVDRGTVSPGKKADMVIFDEKRISDHATFDRPHSFPTGIAFVIINGKVAWNGRSAARSRCGVVIRRAAGS